MFTTSDFEKLQQIMDESRQHRFLLEKLLSSHEETLHILRHELNNTLTMLSGSVQFIETTHPEVRSFKYWDTLQSDITDMSALLNDLSGFHPNQTLHKEAMDTSRFLRELAVSFAASIAHTDAEFVSYIPENLPVITADSLKLKEVLLNLLKNALESFKPTSSAGRISLCSSTEDNYLILQVKDNGCGIPKEQLDLIFNPFFTSKSHGTGLGLAIAKQIIDAHGGTLEVSSEVGCGTAFTVLIPLE